MTSKKRLKQKDVSPNKNGFRLFFNYFYLIFLTSGIIVGFLPINILKDIDRIMWTYPAALTAVFLTCFFLFLNRKAVAETLVESFSAPLQKPIPSKYLLAVGVLISAAFIIFTYRLDALNFWDDEYLVLKAAKGYQETGTYYSWDFIQSTPSEKEYTRAWPHTILVAQSYKLFGVSEWSTRIVSAVSGCIFIGISFFVCAYFTGNLAFSLIVTIIFLLNPDFIYYWRYARMYALLLPTFFLWSFLVHKALEGPVKKAQHEYPKKSLVTEYLNFNWVYMGLSFVFLYFAYHIHKNAMILPIATIIYIFTIATMEKERKYFILLVTIGIASLIIYPLIPEKIVNNLTRYMMFFKVYNPIYLRYMTQRPFYSILNLSLIAGSIIILLYAPRESFRRKILLCTIIVLTTIVFFVYIASFFGVHYRFISHTVPFAILIACFAYFIVLKIFKNKYVLFVGIGLLLLAQTVNFIRLQNVLYHGASNQPFPSVTYKTVKENLKNNEVIFVQGLKDYYMEGIRPGTPTISLGNVKQGTTGTNPYRFENFFNDLLTYRQGWVIWEKYKEFHVDPKVAAYVKTLFKKVHGQGIDTSGVEVFYFDASMIKKPNFK